MPHRVALWHRSFAPHVATIEAPQRIAATGAHPLHVVALAADLIWDDASLGMSLSGLSRRPSLSREQVATCPTMRREQERERSTFQGRRQ